MTSDIPWLNQTSRDRLIQYLGSNGEKKWKQKYQTMNIKGKMRFQSSKKFSEIWMRPYELVLQKHYLAYINTCADIVCSQFHNGNLCPS